MVAKKPADRYASMTEVIAEFETCRAPSAAQLAETEAFDSAPAKKGTGPICRNGPKGASHKLDESPFSLDLDFPVVSPLDPFRPKHAKPAKLSRQRILVASAAAATFLVLLFGVVFMLRTPEGTLVVTVNQPDARVSVDDGKVTLTAPGQEPVQIEVAEGQHTLKVTKGGFETFTDRFSVKSGDRKVLDVKLLPKPVGQSSRVRETHQVESTSRPPNGAFHAPYSPTPDPAAWKAILPADAPAAAMAPFDAATAKKHQEAWAEYLDVPVETTNSIGMKLVLIPPGEFVMGSPEEEIAALLEKFKDEWWQEHASGEGPQHRVRITRAFYVGRHEVTVGQFRAFVEATGYKTEAESDGKGGTAYDEAKNTWEQRPEITWQNPGFAQTDDHPVVQVSWNDCVAFCRWLSGEEAKTYGLPTEAQWEYACRSGSTTRWCFGDNEAELEQYAWYSKKGGNNTHPVGQKSASGFGLFDVHGNVREWCLDRYGKDYYSSSPVDDPTGLTVGSPRVLRGGGWFLDPRYCRSAYRHYTSPGHRYDNLGFRLALVLAE